MNKIIFVFALLILKCQAAITIIKTNETLVDRIAAFGPRIEQDITGYIEIPTNNRYGCEPLEHAKGWIALVERGECSFLKKVKTMQESGALAVIVGDKNFNGWITMYAPGDHSDIAIPSVFVAQYQYKTLLNLLQENPGELNFITLSKDDLMTWPISDVLFIIVISPAVMMFLIYILWKFKHRKLKSGESSDIIKNLPSYKFKKEKIRDIEHTECAICLDDYTEGDSIRTLPCKHEFHTKCVDPWLISHKRYCPVCKYYLSHHSTSNERTPLLNV